MSVSRLTVLNAADWTIDFSILVQLQNMGEEYTMPCPVYLIEHPEGTVLVDAGVSAEMKQDPENYGTHGAPHMSAFVDALDTSEDRQPVNQLADMGVAAEEIDYVVLTHLHNDHAGTIDDFPDAEFIVQEEELRYAFWPDSSQQLFYLEGDFGVLRSPEYSVRPVSGRHDVFGDGSVVTIPTPGHTAGHQSVKVELDDTGTVILSADVANHRTGYEQEHPVSFAWSLAESVDSMRRIKEEVRNEDARLLLHHDRDDIEPVLGPANALE
jgi:glyoxylase-like metal-dependent hydrolase (beta-lactamase superfamily II)